LWYGVRVWHLAGSICGSILIVHKTWCDNMVWCVAALCSNGSVVFCLT